MLNRVRSINSNKLHRYPFYRFLNAANCSILILVERDHQIIFDFILGSGDNFAQEHAKISSRIFSLLAAKLALP